MPALSHLRFPDALSRGRRFPELPHQYRTEFERDRDRIVHARAFRRLENKTQVFPPGVSDHFRTRLTHTLEVSQISRTLAEALGLNEGLVEALALAHDIGHPPFAHAGERVLDEEMRRFGDRFDHNQHALRIVESFEQRYATFPGLNLTFEVREGIVKHSRDLVAGEVPELDEYLPGLRPPLESQLIDLTDEIAYNTADLDDAHSAGVLHLEELIASVRPYQELYETVVQHYPGAPDRILFLETLRRLIDRLVSGLIEGTAEACRRAQVADVDEVRRFPERLARFQPEAAQLNLELKSFLHRRVYDSPDLNRERQSSMQAVQRLFRYLLEHPEQIAETVRDRESDTPLHRVVCDYLAGMTDGYFQKVYRSLLGPSD